MMVLAIIVVLSRHGRHEKAAAGLRSAAALLQRA
jgi:hypothetical protein